MRMRRRGPGVLGTVARTAVIAGTATHVSNNVSRRQAGRQADKQAEHDAEVQAEAQAMLAQQQQAARWTYLGSGMSHPRFRAAYDFLLLRAQAIGVIAETVQAGVDSGDLPGDLDVRVASAALFGVGVTFAGRVEARYTASPQDGHDTFSILTGIGI